MSAGGPDRANLRSAVWILTLAAALVCAVVAWRLGTVAAGRGRHAVGDGRHVESYGFDLEVCLVPREMLVASGLPKDGLPVIDYPRLFGSGSVDSLNRAERGKYLVSSDRVLGVTSGNAARAYPLRALCWHEVVNDTLGGRPLAVTYSPLCDAAAVFDRVCAGDTLMLGVSGLLAGSNLLMYDRRPADRSESLWSQIQARAVSGPAASAGHRLQTWPLAVMRWDDWLARHPTTTILYPEPAYRERYKRDPYGGYAGTEKLLFPVKPLPPASGLRLKDQILAVTAGGHTLVYPLRAMVHRDGGRPAPDGIAVWDIDHQGVHLRLAARAEPLTVWVESVETAEPWSAMQAHWFAWYALRAQDEIRIPVSVPSTSPRHGSAAPL